jgi:CRISPR system Cascade subunit CasB
MREIDPRILGFVAALGDLGPGDRARLRRNAGRPLSESRDGAMDLFYRIRPAKTPEFQEDTYFLLATLYPLATHGGQGNLGQSLRAARGTDNSAGLDRRMAALLDADTEQLRYRIGQAVRYLASQDVPVNWSRLLDDLLRWNHASRYIQRQWARSYYSGEGEPAAAQS